MKKETNYVQCALMRENWHHMAWIPQKFAILNKFIKIEKEDGSLEDGWQVVGVSDKIVKSAQEANEQSQLYKKTRRFSDI